MNKCDGIKILELDPKRILEGNEYMVIAEKEERSAVYQELCKQQRRLGSR